MMIFRFILTFVAVCIYFAAIPISGSASEQETYFEGKTITYLVGSKPGGGYDRYARLIGPYLEKHLPGSQVIVVNRPAGGGVVALNELYGMEPDGLTIMTMNSGLLLSQIAGREGIEFDLAKLGWLGKAGAEARLVVVNKKSGIESFDGWKADDLQKTFVSSSFGSAAFIQTNLFKNAFELNMRVVPGFGGSEAEAALLKGEIDGILTSESNGPELLADDQIVVILRFGVPLIDQFRSVPDAERLAQSDEQKLVSNKIATMTALGRLTATSPNVPEPVLTALRDAYKKALSDPDLLSEAARLNMPIAFLDGEGVEGLVQDFLKQGDSFTKLVENTLKQD